MKPSEAVLELIGLGRGGRRYSLENREAEEVLNIALATLVELSVALDRIDRLERLLAERTAMPLEELRATDYADGPAAQERQEAADALFARALRIRLDPRAAAADPPPADRPAAPRRSARPSRGSPARPARASPGGPRGPAGARPGIRSKK